MGQFDDLIPQDQNDPSDLQGRDRTGGIITPDEMDRLWQSHQRYNEQQRARSMNEPSATQDFISQYSPSRALIAGNPTRASIQNATSSSFDDLIPQPQQQSIGTFDDLIPQGTATVGPLQDVQVGAAQPDYGAQYGSSGPSTDEIAQFLQSPEGQARSRPAQALVDYAKGMVPTDLNAAMRAANIPTDWRDPKQLAELAVPGLKPSLDIAEQAKGRYDQIQAAEHTPAWSQERWNAGLGTALDVAGLGELMRGAARGTPEAPVRPASASEAAPKVETAPPPIERVSPETGDTFTIDPKTGDTLTVNGKPLTAQATETTVPRESSPDELSSSQAQAGQNDTTLREQPGPATVGGDGIGEGAQGGQGIADSGVASERGQGISGGQAGTSNRVNAETYGEESVPGGKGVDTVQLLDNARAAIRSGNLDPYSVLSKTRDKGIANPEEYAALAAEHERLVNDAVAKENAGDPTAPEAARQASDFANAIQPHKTAASDLMRLFQGDLNYDLSTPFGMNEYMKAEIGRGMKPNEAPKFRQRAQDIREAETGAMDAVTRSDVRVQRHYAKVRDIPIEEAASRVKEWLKDCVV